VTEESARANDSSTKDAIAVVLIVIALIGGVVELFFRPFGIAPFAFVLALIGISISMKHRRLGLYATLAVTLCFLIGASVAVWESNPLY
jgi:hypothetical protein